MNESPSQNLQSPPLGRRFAPLGVGLALLLSGCFAQSTGTAKPRERADPPAIVTQGCADLIVLGARGQTQDVSKNRGVGTEVRLTAERLAALQRARSGGSSRIVAVRYDAAATATHDRYLANVAAGATLLRDQLEELADSCPDSRIALIGFSEGAQVVHAAALDMARSSADRVGAVVMIADPRRNPTDEIAHWTYDGPAATRGGRLGAGTPIAANLREAAISMCVASDEVCNARGTQGQAPSLTHRTFYEKAETVRSSANQIDLILTR